jgi:hypothetical protein
LAIDRQQDERRLLEATTFGEFGEKIAGDGTGGGRHKRRSIFGRETATGVAEQAFDGNDAR